jgi:hypothetical protein
LSLRTRSAAASNCASAERVAALRCAGRRRAVDFEAVLRLAVERDVVRFAADVERGVARFAFVDADFDPPVDLDLEPLRLACGIVSPSKGVPDRCTLQTHACRVSVFVWGGRSEKRPDTACYPR